MKLSDNDKDMLELFELIRERPGVHFGSKSLIRLRAFLDGYGFAKFRLLHENPSEPSLIGGFQDWIAKRYNIISTQSWDRIIAFYSIDDVQAFDRFFELWDKFLEEKGIKGSTNQE